jgi:hypothetical protein
MQNLTDADRVWLALAWCALCLLAAVAVATQATGLTHGTIPF